MSRFFWSLIALPALAGGLAAEPAQLAHLAPPREAVPAAFFGMHIHRAAEGTPWPAVPVPSWRLWDAHVAWPNLEPRKGQWNFALLDKYLALAGQHGTRILLPLGGSPQWASSRPLEKSTYGPGFAAEPADMQDWRNYVAAVVTHCKGRVAAYEIWNEPNLKGFWTGNTEQMVALTEEASRTIRGIDPQALIVSPSATMAAGVPWFTQFLAAGGGQYVDVIGFHFYVAPQAPEAMVSLIGQVKQVMADAGMSAKPLWNTEAGWQAPKPFPSDQLAAAYVARAFILNWAAGVQYFFWYAWDNHGWISLEMTQADSRTVTPAGLAYQAVQQWLAGAEMKSCNEDASRTWTCETVRAGSPGWIVWNEAGNATLSIPSAWHAHTMTPLLGEHQPLTGQQIPIGQVPVLVYE